MKVKLTILGTFLFCVVLSAGVVDKSRYDLNAPGLAKAGSVQSGPFDYQVINTNQLGITLINGAYFTIGTNQGVTESRLDDQCGISFGHPFAKTSYSIFSLDGSWYKTDEYFPDPSQSTLWKSGDTLGVTFNSNGLLTYEFMMIAPTDKPQIKLVIKIVNDDTVNHNFGGGLVFDPALGKWGDGKLQFNEDVLSRDTVFTSIIPNTSCQIWERGEEAAGLVMELAFDENPPAKMIAANWQDIYDNHSPDFTFSDLRKLYDLALKLVWDEVDVAPGEEASYAITINLQQPQFNSIAFLRWDVPRVYSMNNNSLFPRGFDTYVQVNNQNETAIDDGELNIFLQQGFKSGLLTYPIDISIDSSLFQKVRLQSQIVYENMIVELQVCIQKDDQIIDNMTIPVFLPATPVSDSGLIVNVDTTIFDQFPKVETFFSVQKTAGNSIYNLQAENIFLYENNQRINNFNLNKDTTGGAAEVDIIFVLDVTGSMGGEINEVKDNIIEFADSLEDRGTDYRLGLVTFLDIIENIYPLTADAYEFQNIIAQQYAHGGGDSPENSLDALMTATRFQFRRSSNRVIIWITDNSYHESDNVTRLSADEVIDSLLATEMTVHSVGRTTFKSSFYDPIILPTGGNFYDIDGNFRDILLDISRFNSTDKYCLSYNSPNSNAQDIRVDLKIRYDGLGGDTSFVYSSNTTKKQNSPLLKVFPNPFNPEITLLIDKQEFIQGDITIFNILGQKVKNISLSENSSQRIVWNAINDAGVRVGSGYYIVRLSLMKLNGERRQEFARILYLK